MTFDMWFLIWGSLFVRFLIELKEMFINNSDKFLSSSGKLSVFNDLVNLYTQSIKYTV